MKKKAVVKKKVVKKKSVNIKDKYQKAVDNMSGEGYDRIKFAPDTTTYVGLISSDFESNFVCFIDDVDGNARRISMSDNRAANRET